MKIHLSTNVALVLLTAARYSGCASSPECGDSVVDTHEVCDDGNNTDGDGCNATCSSTESCGNGILDPGESCEDRNTLDGDGCSSACFSEFCGSGQIDLGEACDDGNRVSGDGCNATCSSDESCGNGILDGREVCDDANTSAGDGCDPTCSSDETCGNGIVDFGEDCDPASPTTKLACSPDCTPTCGNGTFDEGESCDDGGALDGDGCSAACTQEAGASCIYQPLLCVEEGTAWGWDDPADGLDGWFAFQVVQDLVTTPDGQSGGGVELSPTSSTTACDFSGAGYPSWNIILFRNGHTLASEETFDLCVDLWTENGTEPAPVKDCSAFSIGLGWAGSTYGSPGPNRTYTGVTTTPLRGGWTRYRFTDQTQSLDNYRGDEFFVLFAWPTDPGQVRLDNLGRCP